MSSSQRRWNSRVAHLHRCFTLNSINSGVPENNLRRRLNSHALRHQQIQGGTNQTVEHSQFELEAASLGAELAGFYETEMTIDVKCKKFWTDSTAVLSWIKSKDRQKINIANRLNKIAENSNRDDWRHVPGKTNPADHGTRGPAPCDLQKLWITAPSFLIKPEREWTFSGDKPAQTYATQVDDKTSEKPLVDPNRFSNRPRLLGTIRTVFRAVRVLKRSIKRDILGKLDDFAADENKARTFVLRISQSTLFKDTVSRLQSGLPLDMKDKLLPYAPFLVGDGLLRVEGRIQKSGLPFQSKHPVILHSKCRVAKLLIEKTHHNCGHLGIEHVRAHIQATFIIVGIRRALRTLGSTASSADAGEQTMSDRRWLLYQIFAFRSTPKSTLLWILEWTCSYWKIQKPERTQLCLHVYMLGHTSSTLGSLRGPLHWLSTNGYLTFCIQTRIPWCHCLGQRKKTLLELTRQWNSILRKVTNQTTTTCVSSWCNRTSSRRSTHLWHRTSEGFGNDLSSRLKEAYLFSLEAID